AEDGIRDPLVTGVQTCALPISAYAQLSGMMVSPHAYPEVHIHCACAWPVACAVEMFEIDSPYWPTNRFVSGGMRIENGIALPPRSEERRVGECAWVGVAGAR